MGRRIVEMCIVVWPPFRLFMEILFIHGFWFGRVQMFLVWTTSSTQFQMNLETDDAYLFTTTWLIFWTSHSLCIQSSPAPSGCRHTERTVPLSHFKSCQCVAFVTSDMVTFLEGREQSGSVSILYVHINMIYCVSLTDRTECVCHIKCDRDCSLYLLFTCKNASASRLLNKLWLLFACSIH